MIDGKEVSLDIAAEALDNIYMFAELLSNMAGSTGREFSSLTMVLIGNHLIDAVRTVRAHLGVEREEDCD